MGNDALQQLAHEYTVGSITWYEYRKRRQALIDDVTGYHVPDGAKQEHHDQETMSSEPLESNRYKIIVLAVIVAVLIVAAMYSGSDSRKAPSQSGFYQTLSHGTNSA